MRIGFGYDSHLFESGKSLVLGGVVIPECDGLKAHSDGDVLIHAVIDALLGAAALGDIGSHFPDTDDAYLGIDSRILLRRVMASLRDAGYEPGNVDLTIIAQRPKLASYLPEMVQILSADLGIGAECINIKATTEEHLGFTGRGEGISSFAVCLLQKI